MYKKSLKLLKNEAVLLVSIYLTVFFFCILSEPIYSPDTYSYLRAMPYRQMGYVIFLKAFSTVFGSYFETAVVIFHSAFTLLSVNFFFTKISKIFQLKIISKILLLLILLFPFFPPLSIANNLVSEGLGYGLYLLFIALGMDIIFNKRQKNFKYFALIYLALVSVRGQFIFSTLIFAGSYFLIYRKMITEKRHIMNLITFCGIIILSSIAERTYHKLKDGFFKPTPLGYTSASTAPIYFSKKSDYNLIENEDFREIFKRSIDTLTYKGLLVKPEFTTKEAYKFFHNNFPKVCNQTIMTQGFNFYFDKTTPEDWSENQKASFPFFETERACRKFTKVLIIKNFSQWTKFYYVNITYGFKSQLLFWFIVVLFFFSLIKALLNYQRKYGIIFLLSSLILSNAMFIAFASHSIQRYLFYNYALIFLLFLSIYNLLEREPKA